jgi:hypothetical protein
MADFDDILSDWCDSWVTMVDDDDLETHERDELARDDEGGNSDGEVSDDARPED